MAALTAAALVVSGVGTGVFAATAGPDLVRASTQTSTPPLKPSTKRPTTPPGLPGAAFGLVPSTSAGGSSGGAQPSAGHSTAARKPSPKAEPRVNCAKVKCVALTFDDGPGPYTAQLLKHLEAGDAKATFFLLGQQVKQYPELVKAQATAGMELGNHTWNHPQLSRLKKKIVDSQVGRTNRVITKASGGTKAVFLRPPYGDLLRSQRGQVSMPLALWDVDTLDWKTRSTKATIKSASAAKPGDIVLMHDIHESTVRAVPQIVKKLKAKGIHLVTLSTLMGGKVKEHIEYGSGLRPGR